MVPCQQGADRSLQSLRDLLETQSSHMAKVDDLPIGLREPLKRLEESPVGHRGPFVRSGVIGAAGKPDEGGGFGGSRLPSATTHLITETIHGDPKQPGLETPPFLVVGELLNDGAERGLHDLLRKIVVPTLGPDHGMHPRRTSLDDGPPCRLIASCRSRNQSNELFGVVVVHTSTEVYRWPTIGPTAEVTWAGRPNRPIRRSRLPPPHRPVASRN